jgi:ethanolamine ammonia-lyase large subunit
MKLTSTLRGRTYQFRDLKDLLAKANEERSGDHLAQVAAENATERVAAKLALSEVTLNEIRNNPAVPYENDFVTRIVENDLDKDNFEKIKNWTVGELRNYILSSTVNCEDLLKTGKSLTSECIAAVAKTMSNLDLITAASKIRVVVHANSTLGLQGRLSVRLQPNHTVDNPDGILASAMEGLTFGSGDALIGVNPVKEDAASARAILDNLYQFTRTWNIPTQICCLAHITTQMEALNKGAPMDIMFQSLAGSEKGNSAFGITLSMLEEGLAMMKEKGMAAGPNVMYFETGQGSELSSNSHHGADQVVMEARCYGLARHFKPFMVNTVVGFIGPEYLFNGKQVIRAGLEDHFMGKLHGISMGCDVCYTNHMEADQNDLENLAVLLGTAGVNFFMGLPMGDDIMLNYQSTSYHDNAAIRELLGLRPTPEFEAWMEKMGLMANGKLTSLAGNIFIFL